METCEAERLTPRTSGFTPRPSRCFLRQGTLLPFVPFYPGVCVPATYCLGVTLRWTLMVCEILITFLGMPPSQPEKSCCFLNRFFSFLTLTFSRLEHHDLCLCLHRIHEQSLIVRRAPYSRKCRKSFFIGDWNLSLTLKNFILFCSKYDACQKLKARSPLRRGQPYFGF